MDIFNFFTLFIFRQPLKIYSETLKNRANRIFWCGEGEDFLEFQEQAICLLHMCDILVLTKVIIKLNALFAIINLSFSIFYGRYLK